MGERRDDRRGDKRQTGAGRGAGRGGDQNRNREVMVPYELEEDNEFFTIASSGAKYDFIKDLDNKLHSNWIHVLLCNVLISSTGKSHTLDSIYDACVERGLDTEAITKDKLATVLRSDYYLKSETFLDPKIETCRFSLNHQAARPSAFLHDLSKAPSFSALPDDKLKEDGVLFILSMARGIMARDSHYQVSTGEVLFKDMQRLIRENLAIDVNMPGKAIKPINLRTSILEYTTGADGVSVELKTTEGVAISKLEGDKTVKYKFCPKIAPRW